MTIYSIILSSLSFAFIICIIIMSKKIPLLSILLLLFSIIIILIKTVDPTYYNEIISEGITSDDLDKILFTYSFIIFIYCLIKFLVKLLVFLRKVNSRRDNTAIISNLRVPSLDNDSYKHLQQEFNSSNTPMVLFDKTIRINLAFKELLEKDKEELSLEEFNNLIDDNDKDAYNNGLYFRLHFRSLSDWFEKRCFVYHGVNMCVIKRIDDKTYSSITIGEFNELNKKISNLESNESSFGLMLIRLTHIYEVRDNSYFEVNNNSIRIVLACKYLVSIRDFFRNQSLEVYRLDNEEFAFVIKNNVSLDFLVQKINANDNTLNNFCYFLSETKYLIFTKVVICKDYIKKNVDENRIDIVSKEMNRILNDKANASIISDKLKIENNININIKKDIKE